MLTQSFENLSIKDVKLPPKEIRDLPIELQLLILEKLPFEKVVGIDHIVDKKLYVESIHTWNWAAMNGHLNVIKWLHENKKEGCTTRAMDWAADHGHLEIVKWLHENRKEGCTTGAMDRAATNSHLEVVKWLHENRKEGCTTWAIDCAAVNGHLEIVKWLHENAPNTRNVRI